jgi:PIN domain nuclease of toxin-antitoxin system
MDILLDTHASIWFITDDEKLPLVSKNLIENDDNTCYVSIATLWEMGIKYSLGKLELKTDLKRIFDLFLESGLLLMPITPEHILLNARLPFHHRDPFDRLMIAQAKCEGLTVVTIDNLFQEYGLNVIWNEDIDGITQHRARLDRLQSRRTLHLQTETDSGKSLLAMCSGRFSGDASTHRSRSSLR